MLINASERVLCVVCVLGAKSEVDLNVPSACTGLDVHLFRHSTVVMWRVGQGWK